MLLLKAAVEVGDGERRVINQGSIVFLEDTQGKGHKEHAVHDDELLLAMVPVPDGVIIECLSTLE